MWCDKLTQFNNMRNGIIFHLTATPVDSRTRATARKVAQQWPTGSSPGQARPTPRQARAERSKPPYGTPFEIGADLRRSFKTAGRASRASGALLNRFYGEPNG
jgi:hypothetical protein